MAFAERVREEFPDAADRIIGLIRGTIAPETFPTVATWIKECYNPPSRHDRIALAINEAIEGFGVEGLQRASGRFVGDYINMGDSYAATLVYYRERWRVACWGDIVESWNE